MPDFPKRSELKTIGTLYVDNDNHVVLRGLRDPILVTYINDATITVTLYDATEDVVSGASGLSMSYLSGSNGNYRAIIPGTVGLTPPTEYRIVITASNYTFERQGLARAVVGA